MKGISWNCRDRSAITQGMIWNILGMLSAKLRRANGFPDVPDGVLCDKSVFGDWSILALWHFAVYQWQYKVCYVFIPFFHIRDVVWCYRETMCCMLVIRSMLLITISIEVEPPQNVYQVICTVHWVYSKVANDLKCIDIYSYFDWYKYIVSHYAF